jgi:hypothetical protein
MAISPLDVDPPLSLEPIVGWRVWGLDRVGGALTLRSVTRPDHWPARAVMVATCFQHRARTVPDEHCTCGLYAAASPEYLARSGVLGMESSVVGTVSMWGRMIEHTFGARSRFAYPARLRLVCGPCLAVGGGAVKPVRVLGEHGSLKAVCRAHWSGPTARADPAADVEAELLSTYGVELLPIEQLSGGLRPRPVRITRLSVPAVTPIETRRVQVGRLMIGLLFLNVISTLMQPAPDASAAQTDVTSSPPALVSPSRSATGGDVRVVSTSDDQRRRLKIEVSRVSPHPHPSCAPQACSLPVPRSKHVLTMLPREGAQQSSFRPRSSRGDPS